MLGCGAGAAPEHGSTAGPPSSDEGAPTPAPPHVTSGDGGCTHVHIAGQSAFVVHVTVLTTQREVPVGAQVHVGAPASSAGTGGGGDASGAAEGDPVVCAPTTVALPLHPQLSSGMQVNPAPQSVLCVHGRR